MPSSTSRANRTACPGPATCSTANGCRSGRSRARASPPGAPRRPLPAPAEDPRRDRCGVVALSDREEARCAPRDVPCSHLPAADGDGLHARKALQGREGERWRETVAGTSAGFTAVHHPFPPHASAVDPLAEPRLNLTISIRTNRSGPTGPCAGEPEASNRTTARWEGSEFHPILRPRRGPGAGVRHGGEEPARRPQGFRPVRPRQVRRAAHDRAGLETVTGGGIRIGERRVNDRRASARDIAMAFRHHAPEPHTTVAMDRCFAPKPRGVPRPETAITTECAPLADAGVMPVGPGDGGRWVMAALPFRTPAARTCGTGILTRGRRGEASFSSDCDAEVIGTFRGLLEMDAFDGAADDLDDGQQRDLCLDREVKMCVPGSWARPASPTTPRPSCRRRTTSRPGSRPTVGRASRLR